MQVGDEAGDGFVDRAGAAGDALAEVVVVVPAGARELDEAHAFFREPPGHEALRAEARGLGVVRAVECADVRGLVAEVEHAGDGGLHFVGEFEGLDGAFEFGVRRVALRERAAVQLLDEIDLPALAVVGEARVEIRQAASAEAEARALVAGGEKCGAVVPRAAKVGDGIDGDVAGEVRALRAEAVGDPRAHRGADEIFAAGVQRDDGGLVAGVVRRHAIEQAEVVGAAREIREGLGDHEAALSRGLEVEHRAEELVMSAGAGLSSARASSRKFRDGSARHS